MPSCRSYNLIYHCYKRAISVRLLKITLICFPFFFQQTHPLSRCATGTAMRCAAQSLGADSAFWPTSVAPLGSPEDGAVGDEPLGA